MASVIGCQARTYATIHSVPEQYAVDRDRLVALREAAGLSKTALAKKAGVDYSSYWRIEQGRAVNPRIETIQRLARALDVPVERLIAAEPPPPTRHPDDDEAAGAFMHEASAERASLHPEGDATPQLAEAHFFGLVSELGTLTESERAAVLPVLREIVSRRRADRGGRGAGGRAGAGGTA